MNLVGRGGVVLTLRKYNLVQYYFQIRFNSIVYHDVLRLSVKAGRGGDGLPRYNGIGGHGGNVYVVVEKSSVFKKVYDKFRKDGFVVRAEHGESARKVKLVGDSAPHQIIRMPVGVECVDSETKILLARCVTPGLKYLIARGGAGGSVQNNYKGQPGQTAIVDVHLKLRTNVGLLGLPNAGKSTLLKALVPKSNVKIASYPFTTIKPQVLAMNYTKKEDRVEDLFSLSVADLPGIIEGASKNRGRGHSFLKHLEYSEIIVMVVDVHGFQLHGNLGETYRTVIESVGILCHEMELYNAKLLNKPLVLALNKVDIKDGNEKAREASHILSGGSEWLQEVPLDIRPTLPIKLKHVIPICAKEGKIEALKETIQRLHEELHPVEGMEWRSEELDDKSILI